MTFLNMDQMDEETKKNTKTGTETLGVISDLVTQLTIPDKLRNSNYGIEG